MLADEYSANDDEENKFEKILSKFKSLNDSQDLGNTEQYLIDALNTEANVCLICIESIGNKEAIWNCEGCFASLHIFCIQNWIKDGSYLAIANSNENLLIQKEIPWNCPKCRKEYTKSNYPSSYFCYCKKVKDPVFDPWIVPHSCNQKCNKSKLCGHQCLMLCHPGPCPPCPKMVSISCHCSKSSPTPRRCSNKHWSCGKQCNKLLNCKQHLCDKICHQDNCDTCSKTSIQFCRCKKSKKEVYCSQTNWQCEEKCNKKYSCGFHVCELVCHESGKCGECPRSLRRTCPCGKSKFQKPCTEDVPTCGDTCDKPLNCNIHRCIDRCHFGPCDTCRQIVQKKCRCGQKEKALPCFTEFTCESKCNKMRNCGKHKCNKKCCDGNCPPCEQVCNKTLSCKNHKCSSPCHSGSCYPCTLNVEISCTCGLSRVKVPCVKSKSNIKVPCKQQCNLKPKCHHEKIQAHKCHQNECPPCNLKCDKLMACNHRCQSKCHSAVLTEIVENKDRDGPWVPLHVKNVIMNLNCPGCTHPITVKCFGNHETSQLPCYRSQPYNCGRKCGRKLKCTNHKCELECHKQEEECEECEKVCEQPRPKGCEHECSIGSCHIGKCPQCVKLLKLRCHCKSNFVYVECSKWITSNQNEQKIHQSCKVPCSQNLTCGHQCSFICHFGPCSKEQDCQNKVVLKCACKTLRKSLLCNQVLNEPNLIQESKKENGYLLKCNEKCSAKLAKNSQTAVQETQNQLFETSKQNESKNFNNIFFILSLLVLVLGILIYYYFF